MNNSIWKLATLAGVVGIGVLVVLQFQRGLDGHVSGQSEGTQSLTEEEWRDDSSSATILGDRPEGRPHRDSFDDFDGVFSQREPASSRSGGEEAHTGRFPGSQPEGTPPAGRTADASPFYTEDDPFTAQTSARHADSAAYGNGATERRADAEASPRLFPGRVEAAAVDTSRSNPGGAEDEADPFASPRADADSKSTIVLAGHAEPAPFERSFGEEDDGRDRRAAPAVSTDPFDDEPPPRRSASPSERPAMLFLNDDEGDNDAASEPADAGEAPFDLGPQRPQPLAQPATADPFDASFGSDEADEKPASDQSSREDDTVPSLFDRTSDDGPRFGSDAVDRDDSSTPTRSNDAPSDDPFGNATPGESRKGDALLLFDDKDDENADRPREANDSPPQARFGRESVDDDLNLYFDDNPPSAVPSNKTAPESAPPADRSDRARSREDDFSFGEPNSSMKNAKPTETEDATNATDDFGGPALPTFEPLTDSVPFFPDESPRPKGSSLDDAGNDDGSGVEADGRASGAGAANRDGRAAAPEPAPFDDEPALPEKNSPSLERRNDDREEDLDPLEGQNDASKIETAPSSSGFPVIGKPAQPSEDRGRALPIDDVPSVRPQRFDPPPDANRLQSNAIETLDGDGTVSGDSPAGAQRPQLKIEKSAPPNVRLGEPLIYSVLVTNVGDSTAHQVVVEDRIPRGSKLTGTIPQAELIDKRLVWRIGDLAPGEEKKILIRVIPVAAGQIGSVATVNFVAEVAAKTVVTSPRLDVTVSAPEQARLGEPIVLRFTVANIGSGDASGVIVRDIVPDLLRHPGGNDLEYEVGDLPAGESREVKLTLSSVGPGLAVNRAIVTAEGGLTAEATAKINIVGASLQITRSGPSRRLIQTRGVYLNVVGNETSVPIVNAQVVETIPRGMEFVDASHGGTYDEASRTVSWKIDRIEPKQKQTLRITLMPRELGTQVSVVNAFDADGNEVEAVSQTKILGFAALSGDIGGVDRPIAVGERAVFQLRIRNRGSKPATNVNATLIVPDELQVISPNSARDRVVAGRIDFAPLSHIDPGDEIKLQVVMKAAALGDARLELQLQSEEMQRPLKHEEALIIYSLDADVPRLDLP
jgi:uncharacterized repeat protein (TIGR01451 family)